jgi:hypothetical protein
VFGIMQVDDKFSKDLKKERRRNRKERKAETL